MKLTVKLIFIAIIFAIQITDTFGQDGIDTALFNKLGIKKMWVYVKLPILPRKTMNDSCKSEIYEYDSLYRLTYENNKLSCYGWEGSHENFNTYNSKNQLIFTRQNSYGKTNFTKYYYNTNGDQEKIIYKNQDNNDSGISLNIFKYNKQKKVEEVKNINIFGLDTAIFFIKYSYDSFENLKSVLTYNNEMKLIKKETFEFTPISKKLLEFSTEKKVPSESFSKGWNYYNTEAQLIKTHYSNNTWTEFVYDENGLLNKALSYNMQGKLNSLKLYFYEYIKKH
ncbi:MAG: hypothetical protein IT243_03280 [Bacteroidia bacterium]|nr:hypothetical protein [Bacteroidia bacterium]